MAFLHNYPRLVALLKWMSPVLVPLSHLCFLAMVLSFLIICIPGGLSKSIGPVHRLRGFLLKKCRYYWLLSLEGPLFKCIGRCGKTCCRGKCNSKLQVPSFFKVKVIGMGDSFDKNEEFTGRLEAAWTPQLPDNPFHEEYYILSYCEVGKNGEAGEWIERPLKAKDYHKKESGEKQKIIGKAERKRIMIDGLAEQTTMRIRVCSAFRSQRSAWSQVVTRTTFAKPSKEMGHTGPLAKTSPTEAKTYTWWQSKHEVGCTIAIPEDWKGKDIKVRMTGKEIRVRYEPTDKVILEGSLGRPARVEGDLVDWLLENGKLTINLRKEQLMQLWSCFIDADDHPKIDEALLQLFHPGNSMNELSSGDLWQD